MQPPGGTCHFFSNDEMQMVNEGFDNRHGSRQDD
jgi:hypothetical protein